MEFGVCTDTASARALAAAGFGFIELNVQAHLKPEAAEREFAGELRKIEASPLPCAAANCFIPGHLKITGPAVDKARLEAYVSTAMARAGHAGIRTIVFGSGSARQVPDGFDRARAWAQLVDFCGMAAPWAGRHGVTLVVEPLKQGRVQRAHHRGRGGPPGARNGPPRAAPAGRCLPLEQGRRQL
jgi:sugar phosphate isomerase/epimerase